MPRFTDLARKARDRAAFVPKAAPSSDLALLTIRDLRISASTIAVGAKRVPLQGMVSYRVDVKVEEGHRLGNIVISNLYVAATLAFLIGILDEYLPTRFYLAVTLFGLLSCAAIDDLLRSKGLTLYRLLLQAPGGETLAFVTPDGAVMERVTVALDRLLPRVA
jgi:Family of unknown function (DUF6232)